MEKDQKIKYQMRAFMEGIEVTCKSLDKSLTLSSESFFSCKVVSTIKVEFKAKTKGNNETEEMKN